MLIRSPKTEHNPGGASRVTPLFYELRPFLAACRDEADPATVYVVSEHRLGSHNLGTQLERIMEAAKVKPWPKLFQNMRSTRQTELVNAGCPEHEVCKWMGNSEKIARKHYLQHGGEHFQRVTQAPSTPERAQNRAHFSDGKTGQLRAAIDSAVASVDSTGGYTPSSALPCSSVHLFHVPPRGVEPRFSD